MPIMRRAVSLRGLSSAYLAQLPPLSALWQSVQVSPRDAEKNPIVAMNWSTGMPFRTRTFLNAWSAICGCDCALATATAIKNALNILILLFLQTGERPQNGNHRSRVMQAHPLSGDRRKQRNARTKQRHRTPGLLSEIRDD